jgi:hypothetical protein
MKALSESDFKHESARIVKPFTYVHGHSNLIRRLRIFMKQSKFGDSPNTLKLKYLALLLSITAMAACGGGGVTGDPVSGKLIDGYIKGATVCLDINGDGACGSDEPKGITGEGGKWTLHAPAGTNLSNYYIVADVPSTAEDSDNPGIPMVPSKMLGLANEATVISPLTTVVAGFVKEGQDIATAKSNAKNLLGLPSNYDFSADHIENGDSAAHAVARVVNKGLTNVVGSGAIDSAKLQIAISNVSTLAQQAYASPSQVASILNQAEDATKNAQPVYETIANVDLSKSVGYAESNTNWTPLRARFIPKYETSNVYAGYAIFSEEWGAGIQYKNFSTYSSQTSGITKFKIDLYASAGTSDFNKFYVNTNNSYFGHGNEVTVQIPNAKKGKWNTYEVELNSVWGDDNVFTIRSGEPQWAGPLADFAVGRVQFSNDNWVTTQTLTPSSSGWDKWSLNDTYPESFLVTSSLLSRGDLIKAIKTNGSHKVAGMTIANFASGLTGSYVTFKIDLNILGSTKFPIKIFAQATGANGWENTTSTVQVTPSSTDAWETLTVTLQNFKPSEHSTLVIIPDPDNSGLDQTVYISNIKVVAGVNPFK